MNHVEKIEDTLKRIAAQFTVRDIMVAKDDLRWGKDADDARKCLSETDL
jgi:hypothetical protein